MQPKALQCIFIGYLEGVKGYKLWCLESGQKKTIISHDVMFNEEEFPSLKSDGTFCQDGSICQNYNVSVKVEFTPLESQKAIDLGSSTQFQEEDSSQQYQEQGCDDYQLVRDMQRRVTRPPQNNGYEDLVVFALTTTSESSHQELESYQQTMSCDDKEKWQKAIYGR